MVIKSKIMDAEQFKQYDGGEWTVKIALSVEDKLYEYRKNKLPNETGGILIGSYDFEYNICYIVDILTSPEDSIESPNSYVRGSKGVLKKIQNIEKITAGNLSYIGEWHSHPSNNTEQSNDGRILMKAIVEYNSIYSAPGCMVIVGEDHLSIYVENI